MANPYGTDGDVRPDTSLSVDLRVAATPALAEPASSLDAARAGGGPSTLRGQPQNRQVPGGQPQTVTTVERFTQRPFEPTPHDHVLQQEVNMLRQQLAGVEQQFISTELQTVPTSQL